MANKSLVYSLDIGGSSVKQAIVNPYDVNNPIEEYFDSVVLESRKFSDLRNAILGEINKILKKYPIIDKVAISTTGGVDDQTGVVINAGHFEDYKNISWKNILHQEYPFLSDIFTVNDGKASAWAEYKKGENDGHRIFIHLVIGTGIGGAVIINGRFLVGDNNQAGRLGHIKITDEKTIKCSCGSFGCIETLSSAPAMEYQYLRLLDSKGIQYDENVSFSDIAEFAIRGDTFAQEAVEGAGFYLGKAISMLMVIFNPSIVTLGGGVVLALDKDNGENLFVNSAIKSARLYAHRSVRDFTIIKSAEYGNDAGLIGAAQLLSLGKVPRYPDSY